MVAQKKKSARARIGQTLGRYALRHSVAHGGMASVYLATLAGAHQFQRWVAIKVMHEHLSYDEKFVEMFMDEARLAARIQHPNVCQVLDFGEEEGTYFIVMEYLHGETFSQTVKRCWGRDGDLPAGLAARVVGDIARGLHAAHELRTANRELLNVVHRDVSPQNMIVLYDGVAKITDFGIARARGRISSTQSGVLKGKFAYMSPEQLNGEAIDRRSDVWALGVVLWEASVGRRLFRSRSEGETALKVVQGEIPRPSDLNPSIPGQLDDIVLGALSRDIGARIQTAGELAAALDDFIHAQVLRWGPSEVGTYMDRLFRDRRTARDAMLDAREGEQIETIVSEETASDSTLGSHVINRTTETELPAIRPEKRRWGLALLGFCAFVVLIASAGTVFWWNARGPELVAVEIGQGERAGEGGAEAEGGAEIEAEADADAEAETEAVPEGGAEADTETEAGAETEAEAGSESEMETGTAGRSGRSGVARSERSGREVARETGTLNLLAIPRSEVFRRGRSLGTTPLVGQSLPAGRHRLVVRALDGSGEQALIVEIRADERTSRSVRIGGTR